VNKVDEKKLLELMRSVVKEEMQEVKQVVYALRDGQEELKAQMEGLALDVHKLFGEVTAIRQERKRDQDLADIRAGRTEREIIELQTRIDALEQQKN
jgi:predicted  nucleic acid-binding Zn-ribbon protein